MKNSVFYLVTALLAMIIVGCFVKGIKDIKDVSRSDSIEIVDKAEKIEKIEKVPIVVLQPNDNGVVYSGKLLSHCIEGLTKLRAEEITDSTILYAEVHKAIELERGFLKCFNKKHKKSFLSNAEKADSMANEGFAEIDSLGETGVTSNMVEYTDMHFYLERYREMLCYKELISQHTSMSSNIRKALYEEIMAWHKFFDAVTELAVQGVHMDFFAGGSMMAIAAPYCVWMAQECRAKSLRALLYTGITDGNGVPKDYEKLFVDKVTTRANSLYDTSMLEYVQDIDEQKRYKEECELAVKVMLPKVISTLKAWEKKRKTLVGSLYTSGSNRVYDIDVSSVLAELTEIIDISY